VYTYTKKCSCCKALLTVGDVVNQNVIHILPINNQSRIFCLSKQTYFDIEIFKEYDVFRYECGVPVTVYVYNYNRKWKDRITQLNDCFTNTNVLLRFNLIENKFMQAYNKYCLLYLLTKNDIDPKIVNTDVIDYLQKEKIHKANKVNKNNQVQLLNNGLTQTQIFDIVYDKYYDTIKDNNVSKIISKVPIIKINDTWRIHDGWFIVVTDGNKKRNRMLCRFPRELYKQIHQSAIPSWKSQNGVWRCPNGIQRGNGKTKTIYTCKDCQSILKKFDLLTCKDVNEFVEWNRLKNVLTGDITSRTRKTILQEMKNMQTIKFEAIYKKILSVGAGTKNTFKTKKPQNMDIDVKEVEQNNDTSVHRHYSIDNSLVNVRRSKRITSKTLNNIAFAVNHGYKRIESHDENSYIATSMIFHLHCVRLFVIF